MLITVAIIVVVIVPTIAMVILIAIIFVIFLKKGWCGKCKSEESINFLDSYSNRIGEIDLGLYFK